MQNTPTAQNLARYLEETPANLMRPQDFCEKAIELFKDEPNVTVKVHDAHWAEQQGMGSFLSVSRGSVKN